MTNHVKFFRQALLNAQRSPDPSTQNGAIVVEADTGLLLGEGCNEFPRDVRYTPERLERPLKYSFIEHAERNAIFDMGLHSTVEDGMNLTMYALWAACQDCARAIIQSGISTVYTHSFYAGGDVSTEGRKNWGESIQIAFEMFAEAGVQVYFVDDQIMKPGETLLYNGEPVHF